MPFVHLGTARAAKVSANVCSPHARVARRIVVAFAAATTALVSLSSCREATAIRVHAYTDVAWSAGRRVALVAGTDANADLMQAEPSGEVDGPWSSPDLGDLVFVPTDDQTAPVRVLLTMGVTKDPRSCRVEEPSGCIFSRRKVSFVPHRTLTIPISLYASCIGIPCTPDTTCNALGQCVPIELNPDDCMSPEGCFLPGDGVPTGLRPPDGGAPDASLGAGDSEAGTVSITPALVATVDSTCALRSDGRLKCWGYNAHGDLGLGDTNDRGDTPGEMGDALPFVDLGTARTASVIVPPCAILDNHRVKCWGSNSSGELGLGDTNDRGDTPGEMGDALPFVDLGAARTAKAIAASAGPACATLDNDSVKCWGSNSNGQLGIGDINDRGDTPGEMGDALPFVDLGTARTAKAVVAGDFHPCAILDDNRVKCWGWNSGGELGLGDTNDRGNQPGEMGDALPFVDLGAGRTAKAVAAGLNHTCAILDNDRVKCWGTNFNGQLGLGDTNLRGGQSGQMGDALPFVDLGTGRTAKVITSGWGHSCALLDNDRVKCWGFNARGQLGLGDTNDRGDQPGEMGDALPFIDLGTARTAKAITSGHGHTCALLDNDRVKCWGNNGSGQLGLGDTNDRGDEPGEMGDALPFVDLGE
jgi:hypothetical protein